MGGAAAWPCLAAAPGECENGKIDHEEYAKVGACPGPRGATGWGGCIAVPCIGAGEGAGREAGQAREHDAVAATSRSTSPLALRCAGTCLLHARAPASALASAPSPGPAAAFQASGAGRAWPEPVPAVREQRFTRPPPRR